MPTLEPLTLNHHFATLPDPRAAAARRHDLTDVVVIALCATLGGADSWYEIEAFGHAHRDWFQRFLRLPNGIPSHDTFNRVFAALDPGAFQNCFTNWINAVTRHLGLRRYQVDGKAVRGTNDGAGCLHLVSVWADEAGLSLGQVPVEDHSNAIPAIPVLLRMLELQGALVSIDAIGCQKAIAQEVLAQGGDYLLAVKGNQPTLHAAVVEAVEEALETGFVGLEHATLQTEDTGHGRQETRTYTVIRQPAGIATWDEWPQAQAIVAVFRQRVTKGRASDETAYYLTSSTASLETLAAAVRGHWDIENGLHGILDVVFAEDRSRARAGNAGENLAWLRRVAVSLLKQDPSKGSIKAKRKRAGWDTRFLEGLLRSLSQ